MELLSSLKPGDYCVKKVVAAAMFNEVSLYVRQASEEDLRAVPPAGQNKSLALRLTNGDFVVGLIAILGCMSPVDAGDEEVSRWLRFCHDEIDTPLQLLIATSTDSVEMALAPADRATAQANAKEDLARALGKLNSSLVERTFVATESVTLADISLYCSVFTLFKAELVQRAQYPNAYRWMMTCAHHTSLSSVLESIAHSPTTVSSADVSFAGGKWGRGRIRVKELLAIGASSIGKEVVMKGWIRTSRSAEKGKTIFVELTDGSTVKGIQLVLDAETTTGAEAVANCGGVGASLSITGTVVACQGKGQVIEVLVSSATVLGCVLGGDSGEVGGKNYPMAKKQHSLEFLREKAHLRPRSKVFSSAMRVRHALAFATHKFFNDRGFVYVHTPLITAADCEGAGEQFTVTTMLPESGKVSDIATTKGGQIDYAKDFFGRRTGLTVSGQLNVETHACALTDVYTFGPTFRAENSHTSRHLAEFWMIEPEICFAELADDMALAEDYVKFCAAYALENCADELAYFEDEYPAGEKGLRARLKNVVDSDFAQITYTAAIELLQREIANGKEFEKYPSWGDDLGSEHERYICEKIFQKPTIVINYPKGIKSFYMKLNDDNETVAAMDILVPKIGELIGGSQREDRAEVLEERMRAIGLNPSDLWWYLELRKYGTVPHAGFGLGFERLVMFVTGLENIRDVIPFPRVPGHADF